MDTVSEKSSVQSNSGEIDAKSSPTQNGASSVRERPMNDFNSSLEGPGASRSTANGSYLSGPSPRRRVADPGTIQKVEAIVEKVLRSLQGQDESISIALKTKRRSGTASSLPSQAPSSRNQYQLSFPGNTPQEAWRFTVVLRILELVHEALLNNVVVSKRNIYYKDPELFKSQKVVDRYVDILSYTFGIQRQALNVTATAKGLVAGNFAITYHNGSTCPWSGNQDAILIDRVDEMRTIDISGVNWVLVIEKESSFRTLDTSKVYEHSKAGKGIILTAKGYPDVSTRGFLRLLSISSHPPPAMYALVDFDPDGIAIMSTYKHGSAALSHESANLRTPVIRWLGAKSMDLAFTKPNVDIYDDEKGILQLRSRDRKKAVKMLDQELCAEDGVEKEWRRELQVMLMLNMKGEMEMLSQLEGGIERWVEDRICVEALRSGRLGRNSLPSPKDDPQLRD